jgi:hypothetical protein
MCLQSFGQALLHCVQDRVDVFRQGERVRFGLLLDPENDGRLTVGGTLSTLWRCAGPNVAKV